MNVFCNGPAIQAPANGVEFNHPKAEKSTMIYNVKIPIQLLSHLIDNMAESKTYLNVPYAQKDAAKALGARWDATNKKWYVPAGKDIMLFAQWQTASVMPTPPSTATNQTKSRALSSKVSASSKNKNTAKSVITRAVDKDFVAYNGDEPPWD